MRTIKMFLIFLFFVTSLSLAQEKMLMQKVLEEKSFSSESYPVDARQYLERFNKANGIDEKKIGEELQQSVLHKTTAWNFTVGSTKNWIASDLRVNTFYTTPATCRAVGTNCYIFVEDSLWNNRVDQIVVDGVKNAFDSATPSGSINPSKGIYQNEIETFGNPPNVDGDTKIIIFILNIRDGYSGSGGYVAGYFHPINESTTNLNSNKAEIYYLDANPANLTDSNGLQRGMSTTAHEFQHMINLNYLSSNETFFNESWSLVAEVICGYSLFTQSYYNGETNHYLLDWRSSDNTLVLNDYSRAAKFGLYLYEQFGASILKNYLTNRIEGVPGIDSYLQNLSPSTDFRTTFNNWLVANYLNDKSVLPGLTKWGYNYSNIIEVTPKTILNPNVTSSRDSVYKLSAQYIRFTSGENLNINFNTLGFSGIKIKAIKSGTSSKVLEDVSPGINYSVPDFGTTYNNVSFIVYHDNENESTQGPFAYSYTSSGTFENKPVEIAYDNTEPVGYVNQTTGDSVAVQFDALPGTKLDSIRVAIRNLVPINGRILEFFGSTTKLGGKSLGSFTATSKLTTTPPVINTEGEYPYEQPYPNWATVDLRSLNITAEKDFVVEFPYEGIALDKNKVLATYMPNTGVNHSYMYSTESGQWGIYGVSGKDNYVWVILIRAYVSDKTTGVEKVIELMPASFSLNQNYPNPFNPSTEISYQLPTGSLVTLKIYNMLGREVATVINEFQQAGQYVKTFHGTSLPSGVYFYRLAAGNKVETKKMILLK